MTHKLEHVGKPPEIAHKDRMWALRDKDKVHSQKILAKNAAEILVRLSPTQIREIQAQLRIINTLLTEGWTTLEELELDKKFWERMCKNYDVKMPRNQLVGFIFYEPGRQNSEALFAAMSQFDQYLMNGCFTLQDCGITPEQWRKKCEIEEFYSVYMHHAAPSFFGIEKKKLELACTFKDDKQIEMVFYVQGMVTEKGKPGFKVIGYIMDKNGFIRHMLPMLVEEIVEAGVNEEDRYTNAASTYSKNRIVREAIVVFRCMADTRDEVGMLLPDWKIPTFVSQPEPANKIDIN